MALLSIEQEIERAKPDAAFMLGTEYESWMQIWCDHCTYQVQCPLLMVAAMNRTPAPWDLVNSGTVNSYTCTEFEEVEDGQASSV